MLLLVKLLAIAVAPALAIIWFVWSKDRYEREPVGKLIACFFLGVLSTIPAVITETLGMGAGINASSDILETALFTFGVIAFSEEFFKYFFLRFYIYPKKDFNEPFDGIIYSVMIGMGFATAENIMYSLQGGINVALLRMFTAVPAHATFGIIMGYYVGLAKFRRHHERRLLFAGLLLAIIFHGAYNFFLMQQNSSLLILGAFVSLIVGIYYSLKAIRIHQKVSKELAAQKIAETIPDQNQQ